MKLFSQPSRNWSELFHSHQIAATAAAMIPVMMRPEAVIDPAAVATAPPKPETQPPAVVSAVPTVVARPEKSPPSADTAVPIPTMFDRSIAVLEMSAVKPAATWIASTMAPMLSASFAISSGSMLASQSAILSSTSTSLSA